MPTSRKRHMVTETDEVAAALERVRRSDPDHPVNLPELVVLGAERKIELIDARRGNADRRAQLRERFLARTHTGAGIDWTALQDVHEQGWTHTVGA